MKHLRGMHMPLFLFNQGHNLTHYIVGTCLLILLSTATISVSYERTKFLIILNVFPLEKYRLFFIDLWEKKEKKYYLVFYCHIESIFSHLKDGCCTWKFWLFFKVLHLFKWKYFFLSTKIICVIIQKCVLLKGYVETF